MYETIKNHPGCTITELNAYIETLDAADTWDQILPLERDGLVRRVQETNDSWRFYPSDLRVWNPERP